MGYSNIKRFMSAALLMAFMSSAAPVFSDSYYSSSVNSGYMPLNGGINLTDKNEPITLSLRDSDAKQVLRMFADKVGMNIIFHESVHGKVTLDLVKTPINEAFNLVMQIAGLSYYKQGNTMIVIDRRHADNAMYSKQDMMVFPINYVGADRIADFLNKNVFSMQKVGMSGVDAASVNSATNELIVFGMPSDEPIIRKVIDQFDREPFSKTFAVNHTTPAEMANMICNLLLPSRGIGTGSGGGASSGAGGGDFGDMTGGAAGIPTGFAADSSGGSGEIKLGEGTIACTVSSSASGSVTPFDVQNLSIAYFPQRGTVSMMGGSEAQARMIEKFIKNNDIKQPQAMLEISIVELNESGSKEFTNMWNVTTGHTTLNFGSTGLNIEKSQFPAVSEFRLIKAMKGDEVKGAQDDEWVKALEHLPGLQVRWVMNYLIENNKARVLASPKILITNGQESVIDLTQDYVEKVTSEYLTSTQTGSNSAGTVQRTYEIGDDLGIKVSLTPFISPEGYVTLNIKPNYATIKEKIRAIGSADVEDLAATLLSRRDLDLKNVRIKDGETLMIGGMIQEVEEKTTVKLPILGDLPLVGPLFRSSGTSRSKSELVIMITPKIINDGEGSVAGNL